MEHHLRNMVHLDLVERVGCDMLRCLLQVTDTGRISVFFDNGIQSVRCHLALVFLKAHPSQHLGKGEFGENDFLLFVGVVRNVDDCETGHSGALIWSFSLAVAIG